MLVKIASPTEMAALREATSAEKEDRAAASWFWLVMAVEVARSRIAAGVIASRSTSVGVGVARVDVARASRAAVRLERAMVRVDTREGNGSTRRKQTGIWDDNDIQEGPTAYLAFKLHQHACLKLP